MCVCYSCNKIISQYSLSRMSVHKLLYISTIYWQDEPVLKGTQVNLSRLSRYLYMGLHLTVDFTLE